MADILFSEDFDDETEGAIVSTIGPFDISDGSGSVTTGTDGSSEGDFFIVTDGSGEVGVDYVYGGADGLFLASNDLDSISGVPASEDRILSTDGIDISGYENLSFSIDLAQASMDRWDSDTSFDVRVSIDGGAFETILAVEGTGLNTAPQIDTDLDTVGDGAEITTTFQTFTQAISGTGSTLALQIRHFNSDQTFEDIALDNILVEGDLICLASGTRVLTANGERCIEDLEIGDLVITRDNGAQEVRWIGSRTLAPDHLRTFTKHQPVRIRAGALGRNLPERDLLVSPNHRMLISDWKAEALYGLPSALVAAKDLINDQSIYRDTSISEVEYVHVLFDRHEIIFAEGAETESFHPHADGLAAVDADARSELLELFPELEHNSSGLPLAAPVLSSCDLVGTAGALTAFRS
ncbi:MAG: Hint domain-containing protein [Pseudomonadota bacterium]